MKKNIDFNKIIVGLFILSILPNNYITNRLSEIKLNSTKKKLQTSNRCELKLYTSNTYNFFHKSDN